MIHWFCVIPAFALGGLVGASLISLVIGGAENDVQP